MPEAKWRFPDNNYSEEAGLFTPEMETFMKDPLSSLARETCQNSIDVALEGQTAVVEFSLFQIDKSQVPGVIDLEGQIQRCFEYNKDSAQEGKALKDLKDSISSETITCMRISDFNTTGATGVDTNERESNFYKLTRGKGLSDKDPSAGGSKGIGKYAAFVASTTNTVFYSTRTTAGETGYIGISKLRSVPVSEDDDKLMTMGIGYYGLDKMHFPVQEELNLDSNFHRGLNDSGTDIYLIGFEDSPDWKEKIILKILDSFMVAIMREKLEVIVGGVTVSSSTVTQLINDESFENWSTPKTIRGIKAQYDLVRSGEEITITEIDVLDGQSVTLFIREYSQAESHMATKQCVIVRYPYMKITHITTGARLPYSALCVLENGKLMQDLRLIENPQHTEWEINRLNRFPEDRARVDKVQKALKKALRDNIAEFLRSTTGDSTDIIGAGEFLPSQDDFGVMPGDYISSEQPLVSGAEVSKVRVPKTIQSNEHGESLEFGKGDIDKDGEEGQLPKPTDTPPDPNTTPDPTPNPDNDINIGAGDKSVLKKVSLGGMRYNNIVENKNKGRYVCIFTSIYDEEFCDFQVRMCGEASDKYALNIEEASINGQPCILKDGRIVDVRLEKNKTYRISYKVNSNELFASEVIVNAYR